MDKNYRPSLYLSEINYKTPHQTPCELILSKMYSAHEAKDKQQLDFLLDLVFEIQKFWIESDVYKVFDIVDELFHEPQYTEKLFPFIETKYKETAIKLIFDIIGTALSKKEKISKQLYKQMLQLAKTNLIEELVDWHKLDDKELYHYIEFKLHILDRLIYFKPKDVNPILNRIASNKHEAEILIKVTKGIISKKPYQGDDLQPWRV